MTRHRGSFAHLVARQLASARLDDVAVMFIDSLTAQKRLIEAGIGIALLPESSIQEELRLGTLRTIDIPRLQTTVPIHVVYRKNGYLSGASRTLLSRRPRRVEAARENHPHHDLFRQCELPKHCSTGQHRVYPDRLRSTAPLWSASEVMLPLADRAREAMCHVWTAPALQEESGMSAKRSGAAIYPAF
jgi:hypothetical protein